MYMNYFIKRNSLVLLLIIFTLALSITSSPISVLEVLAKSDNASDGGGSDNGNNGKGHDKGGGSDDGNDGGSDDGNDGGSDDGNDGGSDDSNDGASQSSEGNFQTDTKNKQNNNVNKIVSPIVEQTLKDKYGSKVFYVLIKSADNKTIFVPEKVTLTTGSTVVWLNQDSSDHMITVGSNSKSEYALLNSLILPGGMVDQKFQSAGTFYYTDIDSTQSNGVVTILNSGDKDNSTAIPLE